MLTVPKIKDLVNKPINQYNEIISSNTLEKKNDEKQIMENELQNFLKDLKKPEISSSSSNLISANEINSGTAFSSY